MAGLSKSKLMSFLQCPKRLWLEKHHPELAQISAATQAAFDTGHAVGDIARRLYDPAGAGVLIGMERGMGEALRRTAALVADAAATPLFEATFQRDGLLIRADVIDRATARLIEVKASASVKDEHLTDCAIQAWVTESSPARPATVALAYINNQFTYAGDGDYRSLLKEDDITARVAPRRHQVPGWLAAAKAVLKADEPAIRVGSHCHKPYDCPFIAHCWPQTEHPLTTLPHIGRRLDELIARGFTDLRELPPDLVPGEEAQRVWRAARDGRAEINGAARQALAALPYPRHYLDFETMRFAIPRWAGTRPYQQVPFQWSLHIERAPGQLEHAEFLDLGDALPARCAAVALLAATGTDGPVFMYTGFERACLATLAALCPDLAGRLEALGERLLDLHPIAKASYYHPAMHGSWSIKALLPTIAPEMDYALLEGIREGSAAQAAYLEATAAGTSAARKDALRQQLLRYCAHDTLAMVRVAHFLSGD
jgi:hypothetical protein